MKNGSSTTVAGTRLRRASTVHSTSSFAPTSLCPAATDAKATTFFRIGLHVVLVALPTWRPRAYSGTASREAAGYATQRTSKPDEVEGFQHSLGHGVGLEVHEAPSLGLAGHDPLVPGDVLAIEPGLWDKRVGGVTFEDLVLVTEDGCELLTRFPYDLAPAG